MIAWMAVVVLLSAAVAAVAWGLEKVLARAALPTRWTWTAAVSLLAAGPLLAVAWSLAGASAPPAGGSTVALAPTGGGEAATGGSAALAVEGASVPWLDALDPWVPLAWAAASLALAGYLAAAHLRLRRRRRRWKSVRIGGRRVLCSEEVGPGVIGVRHPAVVVPAWVRRLDGRLREMVLLHEEEHVAARDHLLSALGLAAVATVPWNLPLWWCVRRLRDAVEVDCDRRVLEVVGDAEAYGRLLLEADRASAGRAAMERVGLALRPSPTLLERRIELVAGVRDGASGGTGATLAAAGLVALGAAGSAVGGPGGLLPPVPAAVEPAGPTQSTGWEAGKAGIRCRDGGWLGGTGTPVAVRLVGSLRDGPLRLRVVQADPERQDEDRHGRHDDPLVAALSVAGSPMGCRVWSEGAELQLTGPWTAATVTVQVPPGTEVSVGRAGPPDRPRIRVRPGGDGSECLFLDTGETLCGPMGIGREVER